MGELHMTLRKVLVLSATLGVVPFCKAWTSEPMAEVVLDGDMQRNTVAAGVGNDDGVVSEKASPLTEPSVAAGKDETSEDNQDACSTEEIVDSPRGNVDYMSRENIYQVLFDCSCDRGWLSFQSPFEGYLEGLKSQRAAMKDRLNEMVTSVGLSTYIQFAFEEFASSIPNSQAFYIPNIECLYSAEDAERIVNNMFLLQEVYRAVTARNKAVTMDDLCGLESKDLETINGTYKLIDEIAYLTRLTETLNLKIDSDNRTESMTDNQIVKRPVVNKTALLFSLRLGKGAFDKSALSARSRNADGDSGDKK
jgi:hypothetical protein